MPTKKKPRIKIESYVTLPGVGIIVVDVEKESLRPRTHVVGQRLGVGYPSTSAAKRMKHRRLRDKVEAAADRVFGPHAWEWLDQYGTFGVL